MVGVAGCYLDFYLKFVQNRRGKESNLEEFLFEVAACTCFKV